MFPKKVLPPRNFFPTRAENSANRGKIFSNPPDDFFQPPVILHLRASLTSPSRNAKNRNPNFKRSAAAPLLADGTTGGGPSASPGDHTITDRRATRAKIEVQVRKIPRPLRPRKMTRKTSKSSILHPQAPGPKEPQNAPYSC